MMFDGNGLDWRNRMRKLNLLFMVLVGVLLSALPAFAQAGNAAAPVDNSAGLKAIAAGVGFANRRVGGAFGTIPHRARQPAKARRAIREAAPKIQTMRSWAGAD